VLSILRGDVGFSKLTWPTYPKVREHWSRHATWSERLYLVSSRHNRGSSHCPELDLHCCRTPQTFSGHFVLKPRGSRDIPIEVSNGSEIEQLCFVLAGVSKEHLRDCWWRSQDGGLEVVC